MTRANDRPFPHHSPLEGESLKPSRQAPAEAVGGKEAGHTWERA